MKKRLSYIFTYKFSELDESRKMKQLEEKNIQIRVQELWQQFSEDLGRPATAEEVAAELSINVAQVKKVLDMFRSR